MLNATPIQFEITDATQMAVTEVTGYNDRQPDNPPPRATLPPDGPPKTGDWGNMPYIILMAVAAVAFFATLALRVNMGKGKAGK